MSSHSYSAADRRFYDADHERRVRLFLSQYQGIKASIEFLNGGCVAPLTYFGRGGQGVVAEFDGGVYYADASICERGSHLKNGAINKPRALVGMDGFALREGCFVFGGLLKNEHWGHFFAESLSRLWAVDQLPDKYKYLVFYVRDKALPVPRYVYEVLSVVAPRMEVVLVDSPTRFEVLAVPDQIAHPTIGFVAGHELVRENFRRFSAVEAARDELIYVSRSRLGNNEGELVGEEFLERELEKQGYKVIHPQEMSLRDQISAYVGARKIIFAEGSPFHLYALVCSAAQDVFIVRRRRLSVVFDWQVASFGGPVVKGLPCIDEFYIPKIDGGSLLRAKAVLNFNALGDQLAFFGFIDSSVWVSPSRAEIARALKYSCAKAAVDFECVKF